jgi:cyclin D1/2/4, plant
MGFRCGRASSSLLCEEDVAGMFGCNGHDDEEVGLLVLGMDTTFAALPSQSDEVVASLMEKEKEQLHSVATGDYLQRLSSGGLESSCRIAAIDWIKKVSASPSILYSMYMISRASILVRISCFCVLQQNAIYLTPSLT